MGEYNITVFELNPGGALAISRAGFQECRGNDCDVACRGRVLRSRKEVANEVGSLYFIRNVKIQLDQRSINNIFQ
jgi:hypothetical protein